LFAIRKLKAGQYASYQKLMSSPEYGDPSFLQGTHMKQILITGGTSGIGYATARRLRTLGHQVLITGRRADKLSAALATLNQGHDQCPPVQGFLCDQADIEQIQSLGQQLTAASVRLDALILNAGIFEPQSFNELTLTALEHTMRVNFSGPLLLTQTLLPLLNNPASLVFVSSIVVQKAFAGAAAYSASKAAFEGVIGSLNLELSGQGIRVNCVRPGITLTEIQGKSGMSEDAIQGLQNAMQQTPAGRILQAEDLVPALEYLALDGSIGMRNGHLMVDGGYCL
jgi:NAD(P)-dependent dehydrogenase (short-subunit alcohol dehydrogenase family)